MSINNLTVEPGAVTLTDLREHFANTADNIEAQGNHIYQEHAGLLIRLGLKKSCQAKRTAAKDLLKAAIKNEYGQGFADTMFAKYDIHNSSTKVTKNLMDQIARQAQTIARTVNSLITIADNHELQWLLIGVARNKNNDGYDTIPVYQQKLAEDYYQFAAGEHSAENIEFLQAAADYRNTPIDSPDREDKFYHLWNTHLDTTSLKRVDIDFSIMKNLNKYKNGTPQIRDRLLDEAMRHVWNLTQSVTTRYVNSKSAIVQNERALKNRIHNPFHLNLQNSGPLNKRQRVLLSQYAGRMPIRQVACQKAHL
jgi:hypothetical protein